MKKNIRQLAAIMFTDMVGYTALMQTDEHKAKRNRDRHRKVLETLIQDHHGLILQYYGDGTLSVFGSAIEAVECAVQIQQELQKEPKIPLRIGMHVGDIVYSDEGIYGDAVNIASRIESRSVPGGVLISDKLFDEIKNHPEFEVTSLGKFELKNVSRPVELYAICNSGLSVPSKADLTTNIKETAKNIAVLPFTNMSSDPENEYFSDGISEEIINVLTKITGLNVTARTSSFVFKDRDIDIREIGRELGVSKILEGSVRKAGNKVRITAQLVNTSDGFHVFSEVYDRDLQDIFAVQDEISSKIALKLKENLEGPPNKELSENPPTNNLEAYDLYLKGRFFILKESLDKNKQSIDYFNKSIELAPDFALPYVGLSHVYSHYAAFKIIDPGKAYALAKEYALKAIEIDHNLPESHLALAHVCFVNEWDMKRSNESIKKAIQLNPGSPETRSLYSGFLTVQGQLEEALIEAKLAKSLDPLSPMSYYVLGNVYLASGKYSKAVDCYNKVLKDLPFFQIASVLKARSYLHKGDIDKAIDIFKNIPVAPDQSKSAWGSLAYAYSRKSDLNKVYECLDRLKKEEQKGAVEFIDWEYTLIYLALNDFDNMFKYLEKCLKQKVTFTLFLRVDPLFDQFKQEQRFISLLERYIPLISNNIQ